MSDTPVIFPGVPKFIEVTVLSGATTGTAKHHMGTTPRCGRPNPNSDDGFNSRASADATDITVTLEAPASTNITFIVTAMV